MKTLSTRIVSLCPACDACPAVEIYADGRVRIGEEPNLVTLGRAEWNELVRAIKTDALAELE